MPPHLRMTYSNMLRAYCEMLGSIFHQSSSGTRLFDFVMHPQLIDALQAQGIAVAVDQSANNGAGLTEIAW